MAERPQYSATNSRESPTRCLNLDKQSHRDGCRSGRSSVGSGRPPLAASELPCAPKIVEMGPPDHDGVCLTRREDGLGMKCISHEPDGSGGDVGRVPDSRCEGHLVARTHRNLRLRHVPAGRDVDQVDAVIFQDMREADGVIGVPSAVDPVGGRHSHEERQMLRPAAADFLHDPYRQSDAIVETSAIDIRSVVESGERNWCSR